MPIEMRPILAAQSWLLRLPSTAATLRLAAACDRSTRSNSCGFKSARVAASFASPAVSADSSASCRLPLAEPSGELRTRSAAVANSARIFSCRGTKRAELIRLLGVQFIAPVHRGRAGDLRFDLALAVRAVGRTLAETAMRACRSSIGSSAGIGNPLTDRLGNRLQVLQAVLARPVIDHDVNLARQNEHADARRACRESPPARRPETIVRA